LQLFFAWLASAALLAISSTHAADAETGQRLAEARCVPCHVVTGFQPRQVAQAPPFDAIARKYAVSPEAIAFAILDPHPRMNMTVSRREAEDIAAFINTLAR
jgi:mono/diheme cytochrome c family protein